VVVEEQLTLLIEMPEQRIDHIPVEISTTKLQVVAAVEEAADVATVEAVVVVVPVEAAEEEPTTLIIEVI
jgi:hypothetical protein